MEKGKVYLTKTMIIILRIIMVILLVGSGGLIFGNLNLFNGANLIQLIFYISSIGIFYVLYKSDKIDNKYLLIYVLLVALIARGFWLINANTEPVSDFKTMYDAAKSFLNNDNSPFVGSGYIARFPHLTMMVLYFSAIIKFTADPILTIKIINLILSIVSVYLIYKITEEVFESKNKAILAGGIAAIFPPLITYVGVFCTENIAMPFYLLSIYLFILFIKDTNKIKYLIGASIALSVGNLFRMVAAVALIAFICYIVIYNKNSIIEKCKHIILVVIPFLIILVGTSFMLNKLNITEFSLWKGSEPAITNVVKGINIQYGGRWNPDDAAIPEQCNYDYDEMEKVSKEIIKNRLSNTSAIDLAKFYVMKIGGQWSSADLEGAYWSELSTNERKMNVEFKLGNIGEFQIFYFIIMILSYISLFNMKRIISSKPIINLFYIIFCGYGLSYLITETQGRYAYIVCWLFIIFAVSGIDAVKNLKEKRKVKN